MLPKQQRASILPIIVCDHPYFKQVKQQRGTMCTPHTNVQCRVEMNEQATWQRLWSYEFTDYTTEGQAFLAKSDNC